MTKIAKFSLIGALVASPAMGYGIWTTLSDSPEVSQDSVDTDSQNEDSSDDSSDSADSQDSQASGADSGQMQGDSPSASPDASVTNTSETKNGIEKQKSMEGDQEFTKYLNGTISEPDVTKLQNYFKYNG